MKKLEYLSTAVLVSMFLVPTVFASNDSVTPEPISLPAGVSQDWFSQATDYIKKSEYHFLQLNSVNNADNANEANPKSYSASNRRQNLRIEANVEGLKLIPRTEQSWQLELGRPSLTRGQGKIILEPVQPEATNERLTYTYPELTAWYVDREAGLEQGFTLPVRPFSPNEPSGENKSEPLVLSMNLSGTLTATLSADKQKIIFVNPKGEALLNYGELHVTDSMGQNAPAELALVVMGNGEQNIQIVIDDSNAQYPLTVDPVMSTPSWEVEYKMVNGIVAATAGDVNGDGYSDIIVGYPDYDNPATPEIQDGAAFLFFGSATGPSLSFDWQVEGFDGEGLGDSVSSAGDVNGDGYSDVLIGSSRYTNGEKNEGRALLYLGSSSGPGSIPAWTAESNRVNGRFGSGYDSEGGVMSAGDVNGDGYSDIMITAEYGSSFIEPVGGLFLWLGGQTGICAPSSVPSGLGVCGEPSNATWYAFGPRGGDTGYGSIFARDAASAGDVNGDGYSDIMVSDSAYTFRFGAPTRGFVWVWYGGRSGSCDGHVPTGLGPCGVPSIPEIFPGNESWLAEGDSMIGYIHGFGYGVSSAGDVNGDGYSDILIGCTNCPSDSTSGDGAIFLWLGDPDGLGPRGNSENADWIAESEVVETKSYLGFAVAPAGDVNGDGYSDIIAGASKYSTLSDREGAILVWYGGQPGACRGIVSGLGSCGTIKTAPWKVEDDRNTGLGDVVVTAGDVNGDGYSDILGIAQGGPFDRFARAVLYNGSPAGLSTQASKIISSSEWGPNLFGYSVTSAGDVNGDGYSDVVVGDPGYNSREGAAFIFLGSNKGLSSTPAWKDYGKFPGVQFGASVSSAGDVNNDGYSDILVGAPGYDKYADNGGAAFLYQGSPVGLSTLPAWTVLMDYVPGAALGTSVTNAGDLNGDGYGDVAIGAPGYSTRPVAFGREGAVFVWYGSEGGLRGRPLTTIVSANWWARGDQFVTTLPPPNFGAAVASAGDVNGDGYSELLIGAPYYSTTPLAREGAVFMWDGLSMGLGMGPATPDRAIWKANSDQPTSGFGSSVASAGDINSDGKSDILIGAPRYSNPEISEGSLFVWTGGKPGVCSSIPTPSGLGVCGLPSNAVWRAESNSTGSLLGWSVASAGDVNSDGHSDIITSSPNDLTVTSVSPRVVYAWYGGEPDPATGFPLLGPIGTPANADWMVTDGGTLGGFGQSLASAGDVNGDGYSDVLVGAPGLLTDPIVDRGNTALYFGNLIDGLDRIPRQWQVAEPAPISVLGKSDTGALRFHALGRTPFGRGNVRLEWEIKALGVAFDSTGLKRGRTITNTGVPNPDPAIGSRVLLNEVAPIFIPSPTDMYHWRVRVLGVTGPGGGMLPFFPHSPWLTMPDNGFGESDVRIP